MMVRNTRVQLPADEIREFCRRWKVSELALFGSVLREDFGPDSDVDVLVELARDHRLSLFDWLEMIDELEAIFGRPVDLVSKSALRNPFRRHEILTTREVIHAA
jgi:predicted nucleotidyltransferase